MKRAVCALLGLSLLAPCQRQTRADAPTGDVATVPKFLTKEIIDLLEPGTLEIPDGDRFTKLNYRLFRPTVVPNRRYPLILFLNGHAKEQLDFHNVGQLKHLQSIIFRQPTKPELYPFFLLAVQCPKDDEGNWLQWQVKSEPSSTIDPVEASLRILDRLLDEYPIDRQRVTMCGISSGGNAAWELAVRHPERFAAIVPLGSTGLEAARLARMKNVSVWAFQSSGDDPERVRTSVDQLASLGGNAHLTIIPSEKHACWDEAFHDYDTLSWLLAQRIGPNEAEDSGLFSTSIRWQVAKHYVLNSVGRREAWNAVWPRALPLLGAILLFVACRNQLRRTRADSPSTAHALSSEGDVIAAHGDRVSPSC